MRPNDPLYSRELPGGGFVTIEALTPNDGDGFRARITVERRADRSRRTGHTPPVIVEVKGETQDEVYGQLHRVASDNIALARFLLHWQARRSPPRI